MAPVSKERRDGLLAGMQPHFSPPLCIPRPAAFHCGVNKTITAIPSVFVGHYDPFFWCFGHHVGYSRKFPGPVCTWTFKRSRKLRLLLGYFMPLGNSDMPYKRGGYMGTPFVQTSLAY